MAVTKPAMIVKPCHPTNTWSRMSTKFEYIVMHFVGAVSTARNNGDYFANNANLGASAHFFVDETTIVSSCPLDRAAGHCGVDYSNGRAPYWNGRGTNSTNRRSIGIEMCCKKDSAGRWYIEPATVTRAVGLVKWLMQEYGIPASNVIRHYDVCWKTCPEPWVRDPSQWTSFKKRISEEEIDMTVADVKKMIQEAVKETIYGDVKDVPDYWEGSIRKLLDAGTINGGTPAEVNDSDVNLTRTEAKMAHICVTYIDQQLAALEERLTKIIKEGK